MNKKILGLLAASAAVAGSAIFAAPANAVTQDVNVELTVDEVLFLRTFDRVELRVTQGDLSNDLTLEREAVDTTDGTTQIDLTPPILLNESSATTITKTVNELYAVWSNEDNENAPSVTVRVAPGGGELSNGGTGRDFRKAVMSVDNDGVPTTVSRFNPDFDDDDEEQPEEIGGVSLTFNFQDDEDEDVAPIAGTYTGGVLTVEATSIPQ